MTAPAVDTQEIVRALGLIAAPGQVIELRALDVEEPSYRAPHVVSGYFDDWAALAREAAKIGPYAKGVYIIPNVGNPALLARAYNRARAVGKHPTTSDEDILARRWLLVDTDPERPTDISSTDAEHMAALARARAVRDCLTSQGWPVPLLADSGNGGHLMYRVDLPAKDDGLIERALKALAARFGDSEIKVDTTVHNPARIWKLYGTLARKGDDIPDRPNRLARLIETPPALEVVSREMLDALAATLPTEPPKPARQPARTSGNIQIPQWSIDNWIAEHGLDVEGPRPAADGGRRWIFRVCPWDSSHTDGSAFIFQKTDGKLAAGCHHNGCAGKDWAALRSVIEPGWKPYNGHNGHNLPAPEPTPDLAELQASAEKINGAPVADRKAEVLRVAQQAGGLGEVDWAILKDRLKTEGGKATELERVYREARKINIRENTTAGTLSDDVARLDVAQALVTHWKGHTLFDPVFSIWRRWDGGLWAYLEEDDLRAEVLDTALALGARRAGLSGRFIDDVLLFGRLDGRARCADWDTTPGVYFENGRLDPLTGTLYAHDPAHYNTLILPYQWKPDATCPLWTAHLERSVPDEGGRRVLGEHLAAALAGDTAFHKSIVMIGPPRGGKSVTMDVERRALGAFAAETSAVIFDESNQESARRIAPLANCRLVTIDELPAEALKSDGLYKRMAGHGWIEARDMYRSPVRFQWRAKFLFSSNAAPRIFDRSGAVSARLAFVDFPNSLLDTPEAMIPLLAEKIAAAELPGIARWALSFYPEMVKRNAYTENATMRELKAAVIEDSDPLFTFLSERCQRGPSFAVAAVALYQAWKAWALENGCQPGSRTTFKRDLEAMRLAGHRHTDAGSVWDGIALKMGG